MNKNKIFMLIVFVITLGLIVFGVFKMIETNRNTVAVFYIRPTAAAPYQVISDKGIVLAESSEPQVSFPYQKGAHDFTIKSLDTTYQELVKTVVLEGGKSTTTTIVLKSNEKDASEELLKNISSAEEIFSLENGYWVKNPRYYADRTWMSGQLVTTNTDSEGELVILKKNTDTWTIVYSGTALRRRTLEMEGVPEEVLEELGI